MMLLRLFTLIAYCLLFAVAIPANGQLPHSNVPYRGAEDSSHLLDVITPEAGMPPYPVVLMFHGAPDVSRLTFLDMGLPQYLRAGYASILVDYADSVPAAYSDAFCAIAWVYANAEAYQLDTERIALFGVSFGGLAATFVATVTDPTPYLTDCPNTLPDDYEIQGIVTNSGLFVTLTSEMVMLKPYDLLKRLSDLPGDTFGEAVEMLDSAPPAEWGELALGDDVQAALNEFPLAHVHRGEPPHLLVQGLDDTVVPYQDTLNYAAALLSKKVEVQTIFVPRTAHIVPLAAFNRELDTFLARIFA